MFGRSRVAGLAVMVGTGLPLAALLATPVAAAPSSAAQSYGPWSGNVRLEGPVPGGNYPGSDVSATYTLGAQSTGDPSSYAASISWTVSGSGNSHQCADGTGAGYDYSGAGTAAGTVRVAYGGGAYTITADSPATPSFTVTDGCTGQSAGNGSTPLGPATRSQASPQDDQTSLSAIRQTSSNDSWTVYYDLSRTVQASPSPTATHTHKPSSGPPAGATSPASPSASTSPSPSATPTHRRHHHANASPTPSETAASPAAEAGPPPATGPPSTGGSDGNGSGAAAGSGESGLARHVADYSQIPKDTQTLLIDAALAFILVLMLLFPAELFNGTLMENYDEVRGWFGPLGRLGSRLEHHPLLESRPLRWVGTGVFVALTAGVYALVDPEFAFNGPSARLFVALTIGLVAMTVLANGAALLFVRWRYGVGGHLRLRPGTLGIALACVLLSRAVHIEPGYVYGIVAGFQFSRELDRVQEGHAVAAWAGWLFALSITAWLLIEPARHLAERHEGAFLPRVAEEVTAALTVEGLTVLLLALVPIRFLHGERLLRWNRAAWMGIYGLAVFTFFVINVRPEWAGTEATVPLRVWLVLFLAFGLFSVSFWGFFRFRHPQPVESE